MPKESMEDVKCDSDGEGKATETKDEGKLAEDDDDDDGGVSALVLAFCECVPSARAPPPQNSHTKVRDVGCDDGGEAGVF